MPNLDYGKLPPFINRYFEVQLDNGSMLVGAERKYQSGYFDIVRFFGKHSLDPNNVKIESQSGVFEFRDEKIAAFAAKMAAQLRAEGRLYDGPLVTKLVDYDFDSYEPSITIQSANYDSQCAEFAIDREEELFREFGGTLRDYYKQSYPSHKITENPLALCLGICGMLVVEEGGQRFLLKVQRSANLASLENSIGPSAAGSVDYSENDKTLADMIERSMSNEVEEELNLQRDEYKIIPLAFAREIYRGESPQLFCFITTKLSQEILSQRFESVPNDSKEFNSFGFLKFGTNQRVDKTQLAANHEATMNYYLVEEYLNQA